jgi:hypothetical protein
MSLGYSAFKLSFQISPIILTGGLAQSITGGMLPIISITEALNFVDGLLSGASDLDNLDNFFAQFVPVTGGSLIDNQVGEYPFANQAVAANAIIAQPLKISMRMICPVREAFGYAAKLATIEALQAALAQHNSMGGTYTVATPSFLFTNCIMTGMRDASNGDSAQAQNAWQLDFVQPLLTLQAAQQAQNSLMSQISSGAAINGQPAWSGLPPTVGAPPSLAAPSVIPAAANSVASGVSGPPFQ